MLLVFFNGQVVNAARADGGRSLRSEDDPVGMILEDLGVFRRLVIEGRDIHGAGEFVLDGAGVVGLRRHPLRTNYPRPAKWWSEPWWSEPWWLGPWWSASWWCN